MIAIKSKPTGRVILLEDMPMLQVDLQTLEVHAYVQGCDVWLDPAGVTDAEYELAVAVAHRATTVPEVRTV